VPVRYRSIEAVEAQVVNCRRCPRLVAWREKVAREKVKRFRDCDYWARPVPAFGDPKASLLVIGLAPAAHGGNRTGRIFTGDRSGDWLFRGLYRAGFANQPTSVAADDGLQLGGCFVSATARCAPPDNKPTPEEIVNCREYLESEVELLWRHLRVVVVLGKVAFDWWIAYLRRRGIAVPRPLPRFGHLLEHPIESAPVLLCSFHPSQQNTQTGKLTEEMFDAVWTRARELVS
jgi:uracil-DNA glycosylase